MMGTKISRIEKEFVLGNVAEREMDIRLTAKKTEVFGVLVQADDDFLYVRLNDSQVECFPVGTRVAAYFSYYGHVMTFHSTVRGAREDGAIRLDVPEHLYKNLSRKYVRVPAPPKAKVSFATTETKVDLGFPRTEEYDPVEPPDVSEDFDPQNIRTLIDGFRRQTSRKASINNVIMFRDRAPRSFEEKIISRTGKMLFIPSTSGRFPENDYQVGGRIITRGMLLQSDVDGEAGHDRLPSLLAEKREKGILAELYCPILFHEYAIGYVYLAQDREMPGTFDHDLLDYTYQFSKVLAYSLKINGYFKGALPESSNYEGEIIDISAAGLLFSSSSAQLREKLALYTDLDLLLTFDDRKIRVVGRVMRKFVSDEIAFFGLQFMEMKPEDFRFLFEYVYGRSIRPEDERLWEGGADPPELSL